MTDKKEIKYIDLFAGTGAFSLSLNKDYKNKFTPVFSNDFDSSSKKIYDLNFEEKLKLKNLHDIENKDIPNHDLLCGGFPCQPFSIAGEQKGFEDSRSNVFWKILDILRFRKPEIIILENVKNLLSHDKGKTFKTIEDSLKKEDYHIKYKILDTSIITNIPHHRERIYIVGFKDKNKYDKFNFNFEKKELLNISNFLENNIDEKYYYTNRYKVYEEIKNNITKTIEDNTLYQYRRYYVRENKNNCCPTLTANMGSGGHNVPLLKDKKGIRKLTPRECFNLQGFPKDYKLPSVSDGQLYKLAGNAVSVPVVELIIKKIDSIL